MAKPLTVNQLCILLRITEGVLKVYPLIARTVPEDEEEALHELAEQIEMQEQGTEPMDPYEIELEKHVTIWNNLHSSKKLPSWNDLRYSDALANIVELLTDNNPALFE